MKTGAWLLLAVSLTGLALAQANIQKPCASKQELLPDGRIRLTSCDGKAVVVEPDTSSTAAMGANSPATVTDMAMTSKMAQAYEEYEIANLQYEKGQLARNERVFTWQDISSKVMFGLVLLLVLTGLGFAIYQFRTAADIDLSVSTGGLHIKTTLVGVVVLAMSMVFLYLYLFFVYPIKNVGQ